MYFPSNHLRKLHRMLHPNKKVTNKEEDLGMQGRDKWNPKENGEGKISRKEPYIMLQEHLGHIESGDGGLRE